MILETERLLLRPMAPGDLDALVRIWNDPDVGRYLWDGRPVSREQAEAVLSTSLASFQQSGYGLWTLIQRDRAEVISVCGLGFFATMADVELIYSLARECWGRGLATEAARAVLRYGFDVLGLTRIIGLANPANVVSWRVLERLGFRFEELTSYNNEPLRRYALARSVSA